MIAVLAVAAVIWFGAKSIGAPDRLRNAMLVALFALVAFFLVALPDGNTLKEGLGEPVSWILVGGVGALVLFYRKVLSRLRQGPVEDQPPAVDPSKLTPSELDRYARHIVLREIGGPPARARRAMLACSRTRLRTGWRRLVQKRAWWGRCRGLSAR